ncbi:MAG TPA: hypothetical protein IAC03_02640 [Candidatus Coprenecus pullistercoris]|nr:hypothetical protein [Candidatus Coprenecus pullistercoris]
MRSIIAILTVCLLLAVSCGGRGKASDDSATSPFTQEELEPVRGDVVRAEGTGTSASMEMATRIARMNALTVLASKLNPEDSLSATPVVDITLVDRSVYRNESSDSYTVWVLLETHIDSLK